MKPKNQMKLKLTRRKIVATYEFGVSKASPPFRFRLEIGKAGKRYTGHVYRIEYFRVQPTFPQDENGIPELLDDAMLILKDEFIDGRKLARKSAKAVVKMFVAELNSISGAGNEPENEPEIDRIR